MNNFMSFDSEIIYEQIKKLPENPGVYIFKKDDGQVIYVGKAKNLYKRVMHYQQESFSDWKSEKLWSDATSLEFKICKNELDALILEAQLVQAYQPPLNILLKNNTPFLYFYFSNDQVPKFEIIRKIAGKKGRVYGPFLNKKMAREIYEVLNKLFGIRICNRKIKNGCLYFHLGQCAGLCKDEIDINAYKKRLHLVEKLFQNGPQKFIITLKKEVNTLINDLKFEEAGTLSNQIKKLEFSLHDFLEASSIDQYLATEKNTQHIWLFDEITKYLLLCENSEMHLQKKAFFLLDNNENLDEYLQNYYIQNPSPMIIFTNFQINDSKLLNDFFKSWHNKKNDTEFILFTNFLELPTFLVLAKEIFNQELKIAKNLPKILQQLMQTKNQIHKIDCFDISHHQELDIVASCVRFENGKPEKQLFRHFKILGTKIPNDYLSLREAVSRRYNDISSKDLPDLVLIDGGKGQLSSVFKLFPSLEFASLAKKEERIFRVFPKMDPKQKSFDLTFKLNLLSPEALFLTKIRDTAHNFALSFHRKLKNKVK